MNQTPIKINLASGQRPFQKPWINVDAKKQFDGKGNQFPLDYETDAKDLHMFADNSVDIIVAHHLFEHLPIHEAKSYLVEWQRVLKPGGLLSVFVPDLKALAQRWIDGQIDTYTFCVNTYGAYQDSIHDLHKWGYDKQELEDRCQCKAHNTGNIEVAWSEIRGYAPTNPLYEGADIAQDWWILSMEFVK